MYFLFRDGGSMFDDFETTEHEVRVTMNGRQYIHIGIRYSEGGVYGVRDIDLIPPEWTWFGEPSQPMEIMDDYTFPPP
jgi:hypothetical protein